MERTLMQVINEFYIGKKIFVYYSLNPHKDEIEITPWQPYEGGFFPVTITSCSIINQNKMSIGFIPRKISLGEVEKYVMDLEIGLDRELQFIF